MNNIATHPPGSYLPQNQLLAAMNTKDQKLILPHLEWMPLVQHDVLFCPENPIISVHFPISGVVSMVAVMPDGDMSEVGIIGKEGFTGVPVVLGDSWAVHQSMVQVTGEALRIKSVKLQSLCGESGTLHAALLRYVNVQNGLLAQGMACNALHSAEQRLSRWMLLLADRMGSEVLRITHEFLSMMIGSRRATVTIIADVLQNTGVIALRRGEVRILDRPRLEKVACDCYSKMRNMVERLNFAPPPRHAVSAM
jgi:CRP-like cAMP-binding protein